MKIGKATTSDAKNIASLAMQVWLNTYAVDGIRAAFSNYVWEALSPANFLTILNDPNRDIYKVEIDNHLIGFADINYHSVCEAGFRLTVEIEKLYIHENFCHRGIGKQLLDHVVLVLQEKAIDHMWLSVYEGNKRAIRFYEKYGFTCGGELFFELEHERHRNLVMVKRWPLKSNGAQNRLS